MMKKPNMFIVGAPKSGTTALYHYLREHPNIFMSPFKEPHYFATDLKRGVTSQTGYFSLFAGAGASHKVLGEASVWYLYSQDAIENIRAYDQHAKVIVMLRNPVDLVHSKHAQLVYNFEEDERDFEKAWRLQEKRKNGEALPKHAVNAQFLFYRDIGLLGAQVERLIALLPEHQIKIIVFDDFRENPGAIYSEVLSFLDLPDDGRRSFPRVNENCAHRSGMIGRLLRKPPSYLNLPVKEGERLLGREQLWGIDTITRLNTRKQNRPELRPSFRAELNHEFLPDVLKLSELLGRDLTHWVSERAAA